MKIDKSITMEVILAAVEANNGTGFCIHCGHEHMECEPDMRQGECENCGSLAVYGAEELLIQVGI